MNIFSNIGITELIVILLLALLVVGPERLPEMGRKLAKTLRDVRQAYENLTKDLGPELMSIQKTTQELRESVDSVRSIPKDMVDSVVKAAELDDLANDLKGVTQDLDRVTHTVSQAQKAVRNPLGAARDALLPAAHEADQKEAGQGDAEPGGAAGKDDAETSVQVVEEPAVAQAQVIAPVPQEPQAETAPENQARAVKDGSGEEKLSESGQGESHD